MRYFVSLLIVFFTVQVNAQFDTTYQNFSFANAKTLRLSDENLDVTYQKVQLDSVIHPIYQYWLEDNKGKQNLGNANSFFHRFRPIHSHNLSFQLGELDRMGNLEREASFFRVNVPYTSATYQVGPQKEQGIRLIHSQNYKDQFNLAVNFSRHSSLGIYDRQKTEKSDFTAALNFNTKNDQYKAFALWHIGVGEMELNGGISFDSLFLENIQTNRKQFQTAFKEAIGSTDQRMLFQRHTLGLFAKNRKDTTIVKKDYHINLFLENKLRWDYYRFYDTQGDSALYSELLPEWDSTTVQDRTQDFILKTRGGIQISTLKSFKPIASVSQENIKFLNEYTDTAFQNLSFRLDAPFQFLNGKLRAHAFLEQGVDGWNEKGTAAGGRIGYDFQKFGLVHIGFTTSSSLPAFKTLYYRGSHVEWNNSFKLVDKSTLEASYQHKKLNFSIHFQQHSLENYVYYTSDGRPAQHNNVINYSTLNLKKKQRFLKKLFINVDVFYNTIPQNDPLNIPELEAYGQFYFESDVFKHALHTRIGIQGRYFSAFNSYQFMPFNRVFAIENSTQTGDYPYLDFFLVGRVKRAQVFVMFTNVAEGLFDYKYIDTSRYPQPDRAFRFGVKWDFFN